MMSSQAVRVVLSGVEKKLGDSESSIVIRIPKFELRQGEIVSVVGSNGCGKSTLLDMIAMLTKPDRAEDFFICTESEGSKLLLSLSDKEVNRLRRNDIAYIMQSGGLLDFLTLRQNISLVSKLKKGKQANFEQIVTSLGIEKFLGKKPAQLSGGQRQKGAIARALIQQPDIILADEPTSAMDTLSAVSLMENLTERVKKLGSSLILVSHDASLVEAFSHRIYRFSVRQVDNQTISTLEEQVSLSGRGQ